MNKTNYDPLFLVAVNHLLRLEGGYVDDKADPGGATKYGISLRYLQRQKVIDADIHPDGVIDGQDIYDLTMEEAIALYHADWWERYSLADLGAGIAPKMLEMSVNMGMHRAGVLLQKAVNKFVTTPLAVDGVLGPHTRQALAWCSNQDKLLGALRQQAEQFYRDLVAEKPALGKFLNGWIARARA